MSKAEALTQKQEAFCLAFLETGNAAEAYRRSYDVEEASKDSWIYVEACQLLDNPKVAQRVKELREQAQELAIFNVQTAFEEYEEARQLALVHENPSAAVSAVNGKVKLFGLEPPTKRINEITGKGGGPIQTEEVTRDADDFARRMAGLAASNDAAGDGDSKPGDESPT